MPSQLSGTFIRPQAIDALRLPRAAAPAPIIQLPVERNLILAYRRGWQSLDDWQKLAHHVTDIDPRIETFVIQADLRNSYTRKKAAGRPTLVFCSGRLVTFKPIRGKVYQGQQIPKMKQLERMAALGVSVPKTALLTPDLVLDPAEWGEFVIIKPTDLATSSHGLGINLMRTVRVRYKAPEEYPADHPGRRGPMVVQQFVDTGDRIALYRVLTLFGAPLYSQFNRSADPRVDLGADDATIEAAVVATQALEKEKDFVIEPDVIALAKAADAAFPEVPQKGIDIIRDVKTGKIYVLEVNPGGNTWHFSSRYLEEIRASNGPEFEKRRRDQFDAFRTAAKALVAKTNAEAE